MALLIGITEVPIGQYEHTGAISMALDALGRSEHVLSIGSLVDLGPSLLTMYLSQRGRPSWRTPNDLDSDHFWLVVRNDVIV